MFDINVILAKHFAHEGNPDEERLVQEFKQENPIEYKTLQSLWLNKKLSVEDFDPSNIIHKMEENNIKKTGPNRNKLWVLIGLVLLLGMLFIGLTKYNKKDKLPIMIDMANVTKGEKVTLSDGTIVYLDINSKLSYPQSFLEDTRELHLVGNAFFDVARDKDRPFIIHTSQSSIEVLGTSFNVSTDDVETVVSVATGKVEVSNNSNESSIYLSPNQSARVTDNSVERIPVFDSNYLSWKSGVFEFDNTDLSKVIQDLNSFYGEKVVLAKDVKECAFTSKFDNQKLTNILKILQLSCGLELTTNNNIYELR